MELIAGDRHEQLIDRSFPGFQLVVNNLDLFQLVCMHSQVVALLDDLLESVLAHLLPVVPEKVACRLQPVQLVAGDTYVTCIALCLMFLDSDALNVEPFLASALALHHGGILVGLPKPTNAVLFGILDHKINRDLSFEQGFSPFDVLLLVPGVLFGLAGNSCVSVLCVAVAALLPLLHFLAQVIVEK